MKNTIILASLIITLLACGNSNENKKPVEAPNRIKIAVDESLRPVIEAEEMVFEALNDNKFIDFVYTSPGEAMQLMLLDSVKLAIVPRKATKAEQAAMDKEQFKFTQQRIAVDALALIINKTNHDTVYTVPQVKQLLDGSVSDWKQIFAKNTLGKIQVVFDNPSSGAMQYFKDSLLNGADLAKHCFAVKTNEEVIDYVEKNSSAVGVIGLNWISDQDDSKMKGFLNRITVADIIPRKISYESLTYKPIQANVAIRQYPFCRDIYILGRQERISIASDFVNFINGDQGQRIILKAGLVPAKAPIRILQVTK
ncbi:MAG: substrate-binding domain-containing protein [Bacteroidota bacterium]